MKTEKIADIFKEEAGESWEVGDISVVTTDVRFPAPSCSADFSLSICTACKKTFATRYSSAFSVPA